MGKKLPPVALIAGPTASGKSALALALAERTGGVIVNADSAQIYADLCIVSARPSPQDLARADHRLYGFRDGANPCSAAEWASLAKAEIATVHAAGQLPILVGGTGLYVRTLIDGIAPVPPIDPVIRAQVRGSPVDINRAALQQLDPTAAARLAPADTSRIARSLEVIRSTGRPLSEWQSKRTGGLAREITLRPLVLLPPRDWLYERCDRRFETMLDDGQNEVRALLARQLDPAFPVMRAVGVPEIAALVDGKTSREQALAIGAQATRNYAKRQYTWFRRQPPPEWRRFEEVPDGAALPTLVEALLRAH